MIVHDALTDDTGQRWEFRYEENMHYVERDGDMVAQPSTIHDLRYRKDGDGEWLRLPPWADITNGWKINLCFFDEDEETGDITYWDVTSAPLQEAEA